MFTFSLLVSIAQDKDLELSYCVPSVRMIGSSRIVVISQDMTASTNAFIPLINMPPSAVVPCAIAKSGIALLFLERKLSCTFSSLDVTGPLELSFILLRRVPVK